MKQKYHIVTAADIPANWQRINVRKKTKVTIRECNGVEKFTVAWSEQQLTSNPAVDIIVDSNGEQYPCKRDIFEQTYVAHPEGGYVKRGTSTIVKIPDNVSVDVVSLEGAVESVEAPDYIAVGAKNECYANSKTFVEGNLEVVQ